MIDLLKNTLGNIRGYRRLPQEARYEAAKDSRGLPAHDPGIELVIKEGVTWLCRAQDSSRSQDGGVARHFSLIRGWSGSYPETTGYIIPTLLAYARFPEVAASAQLLHGRVRRMLDWLAAIQFPEGGFQGGVVGETPVVPVTFNTGQILMGLAAAVAELGDSYLELMTRTADWLVATQDRDGCWRKHPSPFDSPGEKVYDAHVAWGLLEADRARPNPLYREAALANIRWSLQSQIANGWFGNCCLVDPKEPLTHAIGYVLRGVLEGYCTTGEARLLEAARRTADGLLTALHPDGFLPAKLNARWQGTVQWACLTGTAQIAICWLLLYQHTGDVRYRDAGFRANSYLRRTVMVEGRPETRGGVKGSFPINGGYGTYQYLNWACKFCLDSQMLELAVRRAR